MWKGKEPRCFQRSSIFWSLHRCPRLTRRILLLSSPPLVPIALSPCTRKGHHAHLSSVTSRPHVSTVVVVVPHQEWGSSSTKKKGKTTTHWDGTRCCHERLHRPNCVAHVLCPSEMGQVQKSTEIFIVVSRTKALVSTWVLCIIHRGCKWRGNKNTQT